MAEETTERRITPEELVPMLPPLSPAIYPSDVKREAQWMLEALAEEGWKVVRDE